MAADNDAIIAEVGTPAEVFGRSIEAAPTWRDKYLAADFAFEEARHSQTLCDILDESGEVLVAVLAERPDAAAFWGLDIDDWLSLAVFNFTVDRAGSRQILEYRESSYRPGAGKMGEVLADEEEHYENGVQNLREFAKNPERRAEFQRVFNEMLPNTLKRASAGRAVGTTTSA